MPRSLELLAHHTQSLQSIRTIVRTMKTMSVINAQPYEQAATSIAEYRSIVLTGLQAFMHSHGPLPRTQAVNSQPVIVALGSDHGLCGNYNETVAAEVATHVSPDRKPHIICVGAQMEDALNGLGIATKPALLPPATADGLGRLARELVRQLDQVDQHAGLGAIDALLVYTCREDHGQNRPVSQRLLPLDQSLMDTLADSAWVSNSLPQFNIPADELLAALIRNLLFADLFSAAAEALVTENAARLERMQQAEHSVDERLEELTSETRQVRQDQITTELLDVIIGFEALKHRSSESIVQSPTLRRLPVP